MIAKLGAGIFFFGAILFCVALSIGIWTAVPHIMKMSWFEFLGVCSVVLMFGGAALWSTHAKNY